MEVESIYSPLVVMGGFATSVSSALTLIVTSPRTIQVTLEIYFLDSKYYSFAVNLGTSKGSSVPRYILSSQRNWQG